MNKLPTTSGIYKITCTANGKIYIGSGNNIQRRCKRHESELRGNNHYNSGLQSAWNIYGASAFVFEVVEHCNRTDLTSREQHYIDTLQPFRDNGFNILRTANTSPLSREVLPEVRAKISAAKMGHTLSPEGRAKISAAKTGLKQSPETIAKRRDTMLKNWTPERSAKRSELSRQQMTPEGRAKISAANKNRDFSPEHRAKISAAKRKYLYVITDPNGMEYETLNLNQFCREYGLNQGNMSEVSNGKQSHCKGWKIRKSREISPDDREKS